MPSINKGCFTSFLIQRMKKFGGLKTSASSLKKLLKEAEDD